MTRVHRFLCDLALVPRIWRRLVDDARGSIAWEAKVKAHANDPRTIARRAHRAAEASGEAHLREVAR